MTNRKKNRLWSYPLLNGPVIKLTGGTLQNYGIPSVMYKNVCTPHKRIYGNMYPFDPESQSKAVAHVEDRGHYRKGGVGIHSPTFSIEKYEGVSYFLITQNVYTFNSDGYAKEVFKNVLKAHDKQLKAYESMMTTYYAEKQKRFENRKRKKKDRKARVDSNPEKVSRRATKLEELQKKP